MQQTAFIWVYLHSSSSHRAYQWAPLHSNTFPVPACKHIPCPCLPPPFSLLLQGKFYFSHFIGLCLIKYLHFSYFLFLFIYFWEICSGLSNGVSVIKIVKDELLILWYKNSMYSIVKLIQLSEKKSKTNISLHKLEKYTDCSSPDYYHMCNSRFCCTNIINLL